MSALGPAATPSGSPALGAPPPHLAQAAQGGKLTPRQALDATKQKDFTKGAPPPPTSVCPPLLPSLTLPHLAVVVRFKATGNAPIMKQNFYKITASNQFRTVIAFLRKELGWKPADSLVRPSPSSSSSARSARLLTSSPRTHSSSTSTRPSRLHPTTRSPTCSRCARAGPLFRSSSSRPPPADSLSLLAHAVLRHRGPPHRQLQLDPGLGLSAHVARGAARPPPRPPIPAAAHLLPRYPLAPLVVPHTLLATRLVSFSQRSCLSRRGRERARGSCCICSTGPASSSLETAAELRGGHGGSRYIWVDATVEEGEATARRRGYKEGAPARARRRGRALHEVDGAEARATTQRTLMRGAHASRACRTG